LTGTLYGGDDEYRLRQEIVLGIGGVRLLRALGYDHLERFHMNEGHSALLALELLYEEDPRSDVAGDIERVRAKCIFTTHTPVAAGHDRFPLPMVARTIGSLVPLDLLRRLGGDSELNMTLLALNLSHYVNGVAKRHGETTQHLFPGYPIDSITNGVHSVSWTCDEFAAVFDRHIPGWRRDPFCLRYAIKLPGEEIWSAHAGARRRLFDAVRERSGVSLNPEAFTIGFARRATSYKRPALVLEDLDRLRAVRQRAGPIQFVFAGKAHPHDDGGKALIRTIVERAAVLGQEVPVVYLADYDLALARRMTAGVDLWLNTPQPPLEASGTSGMKAAHNGVPMLSTLDGWWLEGHVEGVTGWSLQGAAELYEKLERTILPLYFTRRPHWIDLMRRTIAFNASFFNSHRMIQQYAAHGYV
jgi:starch phosphorylase